jgi:hypothetical protein
MTLVMHPRTPHDHSNQKRQRDNKVWGKSVFLFYFLLTLLDILNSWMPIHVNLFMPHVKL